MSLDDRYTTIFYLYFYYLIDRLAFSTSTTSTIAIRERGTSDNSTEDIDGLSTSLDLDLDITFVVFTCFVTPTLIGSFPRRYYLG